MSHLLIYNWLFNLWNTFQSMSHLSINDLSLIWVAFPSEYTGNLRFIFQSIIPLLIYNWPFSLWIIFQSELSFNIWIIFQFCLLSILICFKYIINFQSMNKLWICELFFTLWFIFQFWFTFESVGHFSVYDSSVKSMIHLLTCESTFHLTLL